MIGPGKMIWLVGLAAIAGLATVAQLDREARFRPHLAVFVPEPFRAFSQAHFATAALASQASAETTLAEARKLVRRRPIPAEHLVVLAGAQAKAQAGGAELATVQLAGRRGWRDPKAQEAMLRLALAAGDHAEAANRFAALWVLTPDHPQLAHWSRLIFAEPRGRDALARLLANQPRWGEAFDQRASRVIEQRQLEDIKLRASQLQ